MKLRRNQHILIECTEGEGLYPIGLNPFLVAGGDKAEHNRRALIENLESLYGGRWSTRIVYRWRSQQHLRRWLASGARWRGLRRKRAAS